jgi:hypothetical protein
MGDSLWPPGNLVIRGEIKPAPQTPENWWVRIEGVFLYASREAPIEKNGRFSVAGLDMGTYLVQVFDGPKLRHIETIEIDTNRLLTELTISLNR